MSKKRSKKGSVLVADDSVLLQSLMKDLLKDYNISSVDVADDGLEAIHMVQEKDYNLVIMDILMPNMNGLTAIEKIMDIRPDTPIIVLTALQNTKIMSECKKLGVKEFITKPFHNQKMTDLILKYI